MATCTKREPVEKGSDFRLRVHITNLGDGIHVTDQNVGLTCTIKVKPKAEIRSVSCPHWTRTTISSRWPPGPWPGVTYS